MFQIIKNLTNTRNANLKSNIFDRMLSDEMYSIKQQIYDKEITQTTATQTYNKISVPTPTLEVKQKWPVIEFLANFNNNIQHENYKYKDKLSTKMDYGERPEIHYYQEDNTGLKNNQSKVVELRSLSEETSFHKSEGVYQHFDNNLCTCHQPNLYTTCSHRCTESMKICTHTPNATRLLYSPYPAFYMPYQSYMISEISDSQHRNEYYHPYVLNELKLPKKKKHRKTTTEYPDDDLYYDNHNEKGSSKYYDNPENDDALKKPYKKKKNNIVVNIDYDVGKDDKTEPTTGRREDHEGKLFKNVIDDLHSYIKTCYCSSSSKKHFVLSSLFLPLILIRIF